MAGKSLLNILLVLVVLSGAILVTASLPVLAAVYKCDDHGKVVYSGTKCSESAQILSTSSSSDQVVSEHGTLTLYLNSGRAFTTFGSINDAPVTFVVDTGASMTTISLKAAIKAGIKSCFGAGYAATANGLAKTCSVTVHRLSFGTFHLNDVIVNILPALGVDGLLGMNVLRNMKINQQEGVMTISN